MSLEGISHSTSIDSGDRRPHDPLVEYKTIEMFLHLLTDFEPTGNIGDKSGWRVSFVAE
ncbi:hypothetical protein [Kamptonema sp. UHCC 0994]|uniref:hypothetical protein n=1 Tax=Kamptonema sp. UHCC 0994 TaxID=3031329 RepID=UPI0023B8CC17|nr:hypothetical protein [Kamptonema sp. UHCC 0994]MDF0555215.1 hypothetical protein [Kamptonema sp. UHCC 0994]